MSQESHHWAVFYGRTGYRGQSSWGQFHREPVYHRHTCQPPSGDGLFQVTQLGLLRSGRRLTQVQTTQVLITPSHDWSGRMGDTASAGWSLSVGQQHGTNTTPVLAERLKSQQHRRDLCQLQYNLYQAHTSEQDGSECYSACGGAGSGSRPTQPSGLCLVSMTQPGHSQTGACYKCSGPALQTIAWAQETGVCSKTDLTIRQQWTTPCQQWVDIRRCPLFLQ